MSLLQTLSPIDIISALGYFGLFCIVLAESGLFFGFIFPGDSLLFTAGLLASQHLLYLPILLAILPVAAIIGDSIGYWFGTWVGPKIFTRDDSLFFNKQNSIRAEQFYEKHGPRAIILARFLPVVRTFVPIVAGVGRMPYRTFLIYNIIGGLLWGAGVTLLGYFLGSVFPASERYLTLIIIVILVVSTLPIVFEWLKHRRKRASGR